jgi:hypothetical protein
MKRMNEKRMGDLQDVLPRWKPWLPPKQDQAFQQVGSDPHLKFPWVSKYSIRLWNV